MRRREWWQALAGLALVAISLGLISFGALKRQTELTGGGCRTPTTVLGDPQAEAAAVVFHGLSANRRVMQPLGNWLALFGLRVYLVDFPGHGDSTEPYSYERVEMCAAAAVEMLVERKEIQLERTVLVGHSMGAGVALRLADRFPTAATIAMSTALLKAIAGEPGRVVPLELPRRMPVNLLLLTGEYDLPRAKEAARRTLLAAGGERYQPEDFFERRAVRWVQIPLATHVGMLFNRGVFAAAKQWVLLALPENTEEAVSELDLPPPLLAPGLGLLGLMLLFPLAMSRMKKAFQVAEVKEKEERLSWTAPLASWLLAGALAVVLLASGFSVRWLRMFDGEYLASYLLMVGIALLVIERKRAKATLRWELRPVAFCFALGGIAILAFGAWLDWQIHDAWLSAARGWRFALLVPILLPYCAAEEIALGAANSGWRAEARRTILFLILRMVLWVEMGAALFFLGHGAILVLLLVFPLLGFSLVQRLGASAVRRRTGSAAAAALFAAILGGWFIAAVFPLT